MLAIGSNNDYYIWRAQMLGRLVKIRIIINKNILSSTRTRSLFSSSSPLSPRHSLPWTIERVWDSTHSSHGEDSDLIHSLHRHISTVPLSPCVLRPPVPPQCRKWTRHHQNQIQPPRRSSDQSLRVRRRSQRTLQPSRRSSLHAGRRRCRRGPDLLRRRLQRRSCRRGSEEWRMVRFHLRSHGIRAQGSSNFTSNLWWEKEFQMLLRCLLIIEEPDDHSVWIAIDFERWTFCCACAVCLRFCNYISYGYR